MIFKKDGNKIYFSGCDNKATCWDLIANKTVQVAAVCYCISLYQQLTLLLSTKHL